MTLFTVLFFCSVSGNFRFGGTFESEGEAKAVIRAFVHAKFDGVVYNSAFIVTHELGVSFPGGLEPSTGM